MKRTWTTLLLLTAVGCGGEDPAMSPVTFSTQVSEGMALYGENCARCHGDDALGTSTAPPLAGPDALPLDPRAGSVRDVQFRTALDVFNWVRVTMPGDAPGSLSDDVYVKILAFDLKANGVELTAPLDGTSAAEVVLNP